MMKQQIITVQQFGGANINANQGMIRGDTIQISNSMCNINWFTEGVAKFDDNVFYKSGDNDKEWNSCLYSNELPKGINIVTFSILDVNHDDLSGLAFGVVKNDFGPETKLSMFKKKGAGVNAVGFK